MIEPEFKDEERLPLIKKIEDIDDSVYKDTQKASFNDTKQDNDCLLYTSPSPRDATLSRMPSSA